MPSPGIGATTTDAIEALAPRLGAEHLRRRLLQEAAHEARAARRKGDWGTARLVDVGLRLLGLRARARHAARAVHLRQHEAPVARLPEAFEGFTLLQVSDLHIGIVPGQIECLIERLSDLRFDVCVLTGDYRGLTHGSFAEALEGLEQLRPHLGKMAFAVLGNHDSIRMVPAMETMGYRLLLNESMAVPRHGAVIHLAGVDDASHFRTADLQRAARGIPAAGTSILLSHTPEPYRQAAEAGFSLMLSGHTHGGQVCLPGGVALRTELRGPRRLVRGSWRHGGMIGYTTTGIGCSILDARLFCPPEVTLHRLVPSRH